MNKLLLTLVFSAVMALPAAASDFKLTSPQIAPDATIADEQVYKGFGCSGGNVSPQLDWSGAPAGTKSFAVTAYDPDAPTGSGWWHWVVFNIPADVTELKKGAGDPNAGLLPKGAIESRTDFNKLGYGGPCPPKGDKPHHYHFIVHALKTDKLPLEANVPAAMVGYYINANQIGSAELTGLYGR